LLDVLIAMVVLVVAVGGLSGSVVSSLKLARVNEETALADDAARAMSERIQGVDFRDIFATFNDSPADDPGGLPAPGSAFAVPGLNLQEGDADGMAGTILFPTNPAGMVLREDVADASLGMPRDLTGDGLWDAADHSGDYVMLPVTIRVDWAGVTGNRSLELDLLLVD
jgi:hypothetical protein